MGTKRPKAFGYVYKITKLRRCEQLNQANGEPSHTHGHGTLTSEPQPPHHTSAKFAACLDDSDDHPPYPLPIVPVRHHRLNSVHVRAEAPQLHLLALARFDSQGVCVDPLVRRDVRRLRGICEDVEDGRLINDGQERHGRNYLFQDGPDLSLDFRFRFCGRTADDHRGESLAGK